MKLQTALENLEFFAYHGMYPEEKEKGGIFKVDVWVDEELPENHDATQISHLINYEDIFNIVKEEMEIKRDFIEDLGKTILQRIGHHLTEREVLITVKITKPNPAGKFGSGAASITLQY
jgi:7,8-dihydroneopterin aldolase/epimerase/oxygenase